jgi:asparagine synthase (glutamine-hydrolysing)
MCGLIYLSGYKEEKEIAMKSLHRILHRGPDAVNLISSNDKWLGFSRLSIIDLSSNGNQPFEKDSVSYLCNGEIYNFKEIKKKYTKFLFKSRSDCEVLIPLFERGGIKEVVRSIDGEFAFVIYDQKSGQVFAARDAMGIRPLFYGISKKDGQVCFASEAKCLVETCLDIHPFPPGHYYELGEIKQFIDLSVVEEFNNDTHTQIYRNIREKLVSGVVKRMHADCEVGYLLSGGLDSSLVCSIAAKHSAKPIKTFGIGMSEDAIDLKYAKEVADHIGSDHTEVIITREEVLSSLTEVVKSLESWDITTIRASLGMYLICKYIKEKTDIKVLMTGEVSDEIFGYKYTDYAPSPLEFQKEAAKRVKELYIYDVLRADRCISAHSLEARVPFSDTDFVQYVMAINPEKKMNTYGQGKYILRKAFEGDYLPDSILYREKAAFSDAVGHSLVDCIKEYAETLYTENEYKKRKELFKHGKPFT